jgi:hypothetical protein
MVCKRLNVMILTLTALTTAYSAVAQTPKAAEQKPKTVKSWSGSTLGMRTVVPVPEADGSCTPAECEWWARMRDAAYKLQSKDGDKERRVYATVLSEGLEKSYRAPIADRPAMALVLPTKIPSTFGQRRSSPIRQAKVEIELDVRADGSVADVRVVKSFNTHYDQLCLADKLQAMFLPAVKEHRFVAEKGKMTCGYSY